jgi:hypothetical protein
MKLHNDNLQSRIEELEILTSELKSKNRALNEIIKNRTLVEPPSEIESYKKEIAHLNKIITANEEHNKKLPELEKKLRSLKIKYDKDVKALEETNKNLSKRCEELQRDKLNRWNIAEDLDTVNVK